MLYPKNKKIVTTKKLPMTETSNLLHIKVPRHIIEHVYVKEYDLFPCCNTQELFAQGSEYFLQSKDGIFWSLIHQSGDASLSLGTIYSDYKRDSLDINDWISIKKSQHVPVHAKIMTKYGQCKRKPFGMNECWSKLSS
ncbi:MAG: hypothetical protein WCP92_00830 [bacterium]